MRLSLGASRLRLVRQLLTESVLLGLFAGGVALLFSWILMKGVVIMAAQIFPSKYGTLILHVTPDLGVLAYVLVISVIAGILFGLAPALESSRSALKANMQTSPARRHFSTLDCSQHADSQLNSRYQRVHWLRP
jgi:putative ABC transport system permease protein